MSEELKACPFCGSKADIYHDRQDVAVCSNGDCNNCGIPVDEWNTRPMEDTLHKELYDARYEANLANRGFETIEKQDTALRTKLDVAVKLLKNLKPILDKLGYGIGDTLTEIEKVGKDE